MCQPGTVLVTTQGSDKEGFRVTTKRDRDKGVFQSKRFGLPNLGPSSTEGEVTTAELGKGNLRPSLRGEPREGDVGTETRDPYDGPRPGASLVPVTSGNPQGSPVSGNQTKGNPGERGDLPTGPPKVQPNPPHCRVPTSNPLRPTVGSNLTSDGTLETRFLFRRDPVSQGRPVYFLSLL